MANFDAPFGMSSCTRTGSEYVGGLNLYFIPDTDSTIMAVGDPVISAGGADTDGVPSIARATAGTAVRGYIAGFVFNNRDQENLPSFRPASVEAYALVADDPGSRIIIQEDSDAGALTAADVGLNVNFVVANANSTTGKSQVEIDSSTAAVTATLPLKLLGLYQTEDNEFGNNAIWVCSFNTHELKGLTGSTGV